MAALADHNHRSYLFAQIMNAPFKPKCCRDWHESLGKAIGCHIGWAGHGDPHEEAAIGFVTILRTFDDIAVLAGNRICHTSNDPFAVIANDQQNEIGLKLHRLSHPRQIGFPPSDATLRYPLLAFIY